jgi:hypothetical protein
VEQWLARVRQPAPKIHPLDREPGSLVGAEALLLLLEELADRPVGEAEFERVSRQMLAMAEANDLHPDCQNLALFSFGVARCISPAVAEACGNVAAFWRDDLRLVRMQDDVREAEVPSRPLQGGLMVHGVAFQLRRHRDPQFADLGARLETLASELGRMPDYRILE